MPLDPPLKLIAGSLSARAHLDRRLNSGTSDALWVASPLEVGDLVDRDTRLGGCLGGSVHQHVVATPEEIRELCEMEAEEAACEARGELPEPLDVEKKPTWALAHTSILSDLPPSDLDEIVRHATRREVKPRQELFLSEGSRVWFVESGGVKVLRITDDGRKLIEAVVDAGGFFGSLTSTDEDDGG